jgi:hypothetical protein
MQVCLSTTLKMTTRQLRVDALHLARVGKKSFSRLLWLSFTHVAILYTSCSSCYLLHVTSWPDFQQILTPTAFALWGIYLSPATHNLQGHLDLLAAYLFFCAFAVCAWTPDALFQICWFGAASACRRWWRWSLPGVAIRIRIRCHARCDGNLFVWSLATHRRFAASPKDKILFLSSGLRNFRAGPLVDLSTQNWLDEL